MPEGYRAPGSDKCVDAESQLPPIEGPSGTGSASWPLIGILRGGQAVISPRQWKMVFDLFLCFPCFIKRICFSSGPRCLQVPSLCLGHPSSLVPPKPPETPGPSACYSATSFASGALPTASCWQKSSAQQSQWPGPDTHRQTWQAKVRMHRPRTGPCPLRTQALVWQEKEAGKSTPAGFRPLVRSVTAAGSRPPRGCVEWPQGSWKHPPTRPPIRSLGAGTLMGPQSKRCQIKASGPNLLTCK